MKTCPGAAMACTSLEDYDAMIEIENPLIATLSKGDHVDGHDAGSGEVNIFIETNEPQRAYQQIKSALSSHDAWSEIRIVYRGVEGGPYTVLWPGHLTDFRVA
jgi:hypothetical protein